MVAGSSFELHTGSLIFAIASGGISVYSLSTLRAASGFFCV